MGRAEGGGVPARAGLPPAGHPLSLPGREIDLILVREPYLCFVEVKLRKDADLAQARESVTPAKQRKVRTAALRYLSQHPSRLQPRFDVVEVYAPQGVETVLPTIYHLENAF